MLSRSPFSSSKATVMVCSFMSDSTEDTWSSFSMAARAVAAVPPQTTPGVLST
jgi:hypothetical protein